jgi:hypothetical protein
MTDHTQISDNFVVWIEQYQQLVVRGVRSGGRCTKLSAPAQRFSQFSRNRMDMTASQSTVCAATDVVAWQSALKVSWRLSIIM